MEINQEKPTQTPPKYNPSKKYKWDPGTQFLFSGDEFGQLLNSIRAILNTPEARKIILAQQAHDAIEIALGRAVEIGIVQEMQEPPSPTPKGFDLPQMKKTT